MTDKKIKIAALIDSTIFRVGLSDVLNRLPGVDYLGVCVSEDLAGFLRNNKPDVFFLSSRDGRTSDMPLAVALKKVYPSVKTAALLGDVREGNLKQYLDAGFNGLLLKNTNHTELEYAIRVMYGGGTYIAQDIASAVFNNQENPNDQTACKLKECRLSRREMQVMYMVFREYTNQEIARKLNISTRTVESHRNNIITKIGAKNSIGIVKFIFQNRLAAHLKKHIQE